MKLILTTLFLLMLNYSFCQTVAQTIQKDFETIIEATRQQNMDQVLEMTYPKLFEVYPKEMISGMLTGMLQSMGIQTMYEDNETNLMLSPVKELSKSATTVCVGRYDQNMILEFNDDEMGKMFSNYPMEGYTIEVISPRQIKMSGISYLLAINDRSTDHLWKYLNFVDDASSPLNDTAILAPEIVEEVRKLIEGF